jgi:hypothetical protein
MSDNKKNKISKTFCILPWIHLSTRPNGHLRCCCTACASSAAPVVTKAEVGYIKNPNGRPANLNTCDLLTAWNNDYMKNIRLAMMRGDIPPSCEKCFKEDAAGFQSKRNWETKLWLKRIPIEKILKNTNKDGSISPKIAYVDLRLGSKCDLKCIMCSPHDSSDWIPDWLKLYPNIENKRLKQIMMWNDKGRTDDGGYDWHKNNKRFWKQFYEQIPNLRQLYFAGGEPLIIDEHYELLRECIKQGYAKKMELRYNSNGLTLPEELFELWDHFKKVKFGFSLDSVDKMNHYIRHPSDWNTVIKNLKRLDETPKNIEVTIACAVQALNVYYVPDFIKWKLSMNFKKINAWPVGAGLVNSHFVYHPAHLNVKALPLWFKDEVKEKFEDFYEWLKKENKNNPEFNKHPYGIERLKAMVDFVYSEDWSSLMPAFKEYIIKMDEIRGTDFSKTFPEMKELIK